MLYPLSYGGVPEDSSMPVTRAHGSRMLIAAEWESSTQCQAEEGLMRRGSLVGAALIVALLAAAVVWYLLRVEDLPEPELIHYWPLTGEVAPDEDATRTRVVSVKIENSSAARPQAGLADADVVYETLSEGGIPRFNALFHSALPARVGPVRSARISDTYLVPQYVALFAYTGASEEIRRRIQAAEIDDLGMERQPGLYERDPGRSAPHDVYTNAAEVQAAAGGAGFPTVVVPRGFLFGDVPEALAEAPAATRIDVPFAGGNDVTWMWDETRDVWLRYVAGAPHVDEGAAEPYTASNVVVMYAETRETDLRDVTGAPVLDIRLDGSGSAVVLREGRRYEVGWTASPGVPPRFEAADGTEFPLAAGNTWIEVVAPGHDVSID